MRSSFDAMQDETQDLALLEEPGPATEHEGCAAERAVRGAPATVWVTGIIGVLAVIALAVL